MCTGLWAAKENAFVPRFNYPFTLVWCSFMMSRETDIGKEELFPGHQLKNKEIRRPKYTLYRNVRGGNPIFYKNISVGDI